MYFGRPWRTLANMPGKNKNFLGVREWNEINTNTTPQVHIWLLNRRCHSQKSRKVASVSSIRFWLKGCGPPHACNTWTGDRHFADGSLEFGSVRRLFAWAPHVLVIFRKGSQRQTDALGSCWVFRIPEDPQRTPRIARQANKREEPLNHPLW